MSVSYLGDHSAEVEFTVAQVLDRASSANLSAAMIIGLRDDGTLFFETSIADGSDTVWMLEKVKFAILTESFK